MPTKSTVEQLMKEEDKDRTKKAALDFLQSSKGAYIMGQALYLAIRVLEKIPPPKKEISSILDMQFLMNNLFPSYKVAQESLLKKEAINEKKTK